MKPNQHFHKPPYKVETCHGKWKDREWTVFVVLNRDGINPDLPVFYIKENADKLCADLNQ
jgi:hypothetical protein